MNNICSRVNDPISLCSICPFSKNIDTCTFGGGERCLTSIFYEFYRHNISFNTTSNYYSDAWFTLFLEDKND